MLRYIDAKKKELTLLRLLTKSLQNPRHLTGVLLLKRHVTQHRTQTTQVRICLHRAVSSVCGCVQYEKDRAAYVQTGKPQTCKPGGGHGWEASILYLLDSSGTEAPIRPKLTSVELPERFRTKNTHFKKQTLAENYDEGLSVV